MNKKVTDNVMELDVLEMQKELEILEKKKQEEPRNFLRNFFKIF